MRFNNFLGIQPSGSAAEKLVSATGGCLGISLIFYCSYLFTGYQGAMAILPSMGAATVLLFAVPHGTLSQPWPLFAGNALSALIGVFCAQWISNVFVAAGVAVGAAIGVMYICRCIHPPGGATALAAVIGGEGIRQLGYSYILIPTLLNCLIIFLVAVTFNNMFHWRRYPLGLMKYEKSPVQKTEEGVQLYHIKQAMKKLDTVLDVTEEQIFQVFEAAKRIMLDEVVNQFQLELGAFYTNGKAGREWSVRQVVDESPHENPVHHMVIYRTVDGYNQHKSGSCTLDEFALWAKEKMQPVATS